MFISQCVGYMFGECIISDSFGQEAALIIEVLSRIAGITMNRFTDKFGMGKVITAGAALQMLGCEERYSGSLSAGTMALNGSMTL